MKTGLLAKMSVGLGFILFPSIASASAGTGERLDLTAHWVGYSSLGVFLLAYLFVMAEEFTHLRKSKPVILASGVIWAFIGITYVNHGLPTRLKWRFGTTYWNTPNFSCSCWSL